MTQPTEEPRLNADFLDIVEALHQAAARFLVVGAHALAAHGVPRATGDFDILVEPTLVNAQRVVAALQAFGAPVEVHGIAVADIATPGLVYQIGLPPRRIDLLTRIDGVSFDEAWNGRLEVPLGGTSVPVLGRAELIRNKLATGREQDRVDVLLLTSQDATAL